ncbi:30S ribosomal protein S18 [uncultured Mycobacterium sp.]|uniref:30S ribosomal protein S18 n=1 Tax=uncultured Mycobacterium sp. TaxID=171292 RepID=UPI0035CA5887
MAGKSARNRQASRPEIKPGKKNLLTTLGLSAVDYKDTATLRAFVSDRGKIRSRRVTGLTVKQQRQVTLAVKNAREMALLPYPGQGRPINKPGGAATSARGEP